MFFFLSHTHRDFQTPWPAASSTVTWNVNLVSSSAVIKAGFLTFYLGLFTQYRRCVTHTHTRLKCHPTRLQLCLRGRKVSWSLHEEFKYFIVPFLVLKLTIETPFALSSSVQLIIDIWHLQPLWLCLRTQCQKVSWMATLKTLYLAFSGVKINHLNSNWSELFCPVLVTCPSAFILQEVS